jgi:hypothetical protein
MQERCRSQAVQPGFQGLRCLKARPLAHFQAWERYLPSSLRNEKIWQSFAHPVGAVRLARLVHTNSWSYMDGYLLTAQLRRRIPVLLAIASVACVPARGIGNRTIRTARPAVHARTRYRSHETVLTDACSYEQEAAGSSASERSPAGDVGLVSGTRIEHRLNLLARGSSAPVPLAIHHAVVAWERGVAGACRAPVYLRHVSLLI